MIPFEIEQLRRLPQRLDEVWQGGWIRPPMRVVGDDGELMAVRMAVWASVRTGLVNGGEGDGGATPAEAGWRCTGGRMTPVEPTAAPPIRS